jgi:hypothetical protein
VSTPLQLKSFPRLQVKGQEVCLVEPSQLESLVTQANNLPGIRASMELALERLQRFQSKGYLTGHDLAIAGLKQAIANIKSS